MIQSIWINRISFTVSWIDGKVSYREAILLINKNIQNTPHCGIDRHRQRKLKRRKVRGGDREIERKSYKKGKRMFRLKNCVWMCVGVCNPIRILIIALEDNNIHQSLSYYKYIRQETRMTTSISSKDSLKDKQAKWIMRRSW